MPHAHVVFLKLKATADAPAILSELAALRTLIPGMLAFSGGFNDSTENLGGFTHAFTMIFESAAARDAYLPHPEHERVKALVIAGLAEGGGSVAVVDYPLPA